MDSLNDYLTIVKKKILEDEEHLPPLRIIIQGFIKGIALASMPKLIGKGLGSQRILACGLTVAAVRAFSLAINDTSLVKHKHSLCGILASSIFTLIDGKIHESNIFVFWLFFRSLYHYVPSLSNGSVLVMCLASSPLMSAWIMAPWTLHPTYAKFLTSTSGLKSTDIEYYTNSGTIRNRPCFMVHPHLSCEENIFPFFIDVWLRGLSVYTPFYVLSFLFGSRKDFHTIIPNILRSCCFAATYALLGWIGVCANYRFFPGLTREKILFHSWISGLALLIEPTKRRGNLTLYVVAFLADCLFNTWQEKTQIGKATKLPSKLMLLIATSLIFNQNQNSGFMKWLFTI